MPASTFIQKIPSLLRKRLNARCADVCVGGPLTVLPFPACFGADQRNTGKNNPGLTSTLLFRAAYPASLVLLLPISAEQSRLIASLTGTTADTVLGFECFQTTTLTCTPPAGSFERETDEHRAGQLVRWWCPGGCGVREEPATALELGSLSFQCVIKHSRGWLWPPSPMMRRKALLILPSCCR